MSDSRDKESPQSSSKGEKRPIDDIQVQDVHSSNSWETAYLGDDERKKKFLRLMGAGKKTHQGRFVIGDSHGKHTSASDSQRAAEHIEEQYNKSIESKTAFGPTGRHRGIGFQPEPEESTPKPEDTEAKPSSSTDQSSTKPEISVNEVHSTNSWETADLGDDDRKQKFLRLMGAGKKKHQGRFVIGSATTKHKTAEESQQDSQNIEQQYRDTMQMKLTGAVSRHRGIGFVEEEPKPPSDNPGTSEAQPSTTETNTGTEPSGNAPEAQSSSRGSNSPRLSGRPYDQGNASHEDRHSYLQRQGPGYDYRSEANRWRPASDERGSYEKTSHEYSSMSKPVRYEKSSHEYSSKPVPYERSSHEYSSKPVPYERSSHEHSSQPVRYERSAHEQYPPPVPHEKPSYGNFPPQSSPYDQRYQRQEHSHSNSRDNRHKDDGDKSRDGTYGPPTGKSSQSHASRYSDYYY